jgi:hypothetical protein
MRGWSSRKQRDLVGVLLALCCWALPVASAGAVEPSAAWKLGVFSYPTNFKPGMPAEEEGKVGFMVRARNTGGRASIGEYKLVDTLPAGFNPTGTSNSPGLTCEIAGAIVTCTGTEPVPAGQTIESQISVEVSPSASEPAANLAEVEGGGVGASLLESPVSLSGVTPDFDFMPGGEGVFGGYLGANGGEAAQAGSTLTQAGVDLAFPILPAAIRNEFSDTYRAPDGGVKTVEVDLPKGVAVNPAAAPKCTEAQLQSFSCPPASQVGMVRLTLGLFSEAPTIFEPPVYNMKAPPGVSAVLAFEVEEGVYVHILGKVRSESDYGLSALITLIPSRLGFMGAETELWGVPSATTHDARRACPSTLQPCDSVERTGKSFMTMPTSCEGPLQTDARAASWNNPKTFHEGSFESAGMEGCNQLEFKPTIKSQATTPLADSPSGLEFDLHMPQTGVGADPEAEPQLQTANLKDATVTLPRGVTLNPSAANGLEACASGQIGLKTPVGQAQPVHFSNQSPGCPNASKLGNVEVTTPLLEDPLMGSFYLAKPFDNPFGSLLAVYLAVEDEQTGIVAKLPGRVESDPVTGQLVTTFEESPELPIEDVKLSLFNGARASLKTSLTCGSQVTNSLLIPWTTPAGEDATPSDEFQTSVEPGGGACPNSESGAPKVLSFRAGTLAPSAGSFSPFLLRLARPDGSQQITGVETVLPAGLSGKLAGITTCSEGGIALARSREAVNHGAEEIASPACPAASEVGTVTVGVGAGISPTYVQGHVYLAGPYKGAPFSFVVITPGIAGPFDLGDVVTRIATYVNQESAQIRAISDPLPTILDGIPLDVRSIALTLDHPGFTLNPTSCEAMAIEGTATMASGQTMALENSFQVGGCKALSYKPKLTLQFKGTTHRRSHPQIIANLRAKPGEANTASAQVVLPKAGLLDNAHIGTICTRVQFAAEACPAKSVYGSAWAKSPLVDYPVSGPVYLRSSSHTLPDLVADLHGPASQPIRVALVGRTDSVKGALRNTFEATPDLPVSSFHLQLFGGKKGLVILGDGFCASRKAKIRLTAHNGKQYFAEPPIKAKCGPERKAKGKHAHR